MLNFLCGFILPNCCVLCGSKCGDNQLLCRGCEADLPYIRQACSHCGAIMKSSYCSEVGRCGACMENDLPFDHNFALFQYRSPIDRLLIDLKFKHKLLYAKLLGELLADKIINYYNHRIKPDLIIPVPLHYKRLEERGFNQSHEIAKVISKKLAVAIEKHKCIRLRHTLAQSGLPFAERKQNVRKAFAVKKNFNGQKALIVDDVLTSGTTVYEFCKELKRSGAGSLDVWCCARAYGGDA